MLLNLHLTMQWPHTSQSAERSMKGSFSDVSGESGEKQLSMMHEPENERKSQLQSWHLHLFVTALSGFQNVSLGSFLQVT